MKKFILSFLFFILVTTSHASEGELSSEFLESETIKYWILDISDADD